MRAIMQMLEEEANCLVVGQQMRKDVNKKVASVVVRVLMKFASNQVGILRSLAPEVSYALV